MGVKKANAAQFATPGPSLLESAACSQCPGVLHKAAQNSHMLHLRCDLAPADTRKEFTGWIAFQLSTPEHSPFSASQQRPGVDLEDGALHWSVSGKHAGDCPACLPTGLK
jgi:hypothetical protein